MSWSGSDRCIPKISPGSSVPELFNFIRHSFRKSEFDEVQNILMDREKKMELEMQNIERDRDSLKEEVRLLERTQGLGEVEKSKLEEKLQRSQRKCEELEETITRLTEELVVNSDKAKRAECHLDRISKENSMMTNGKNKLIFELNEKINVLKNKNLESKQLVGKYEEKLKNADMRLVKMCQELDSLRHEKLAMDQTVEKFKRKQLEVDQAMEELKCQNLDANRTTGELRLEVAELRQKKIESDMEVELHKNRLMDLEPRIMNVAAAFANMLNVKEEDLANHVRVLEAAAAKGLLSTSNSNQSGGIGFPNKARRNMAHSWKKEYGILIGPQSRQSPHIESDASTAKDNEVDEPRVSGSHSDRGIPIIGKSMFGDIIVIDDSDDEMDPGDMARVSDQTCKRNRADCIEDSPVNSNTNRRSSISICKEEKEDVLFDVDSADSLEDESCSDADMEALVASCKLAK